MPGRIALHGGGEFQPGDERFLRAIIVAADEDGDPSAVLRIVVVPTAAARGRPDLAAANGVRALEGVTAELGRAADVTVAPVVDSASAADMAIASALAAADVIHLPGG